jgi:3-methyladenine DNA glycosylase AlkD
MTSAQALRELEAAGTEQNRKVYRRHGIRNEQYGVSYAAQRSLAKKAGRDQQLAEELWTSGNHDARILATIVADPDAVPAKTIDAWSRDLDNYVIMDAFSAFVAQTRHAPDRAQRWMNASKEMLSAAGWNIIATLAMQADAFDDATLQSFLETIESDIHERRNRVRHSMNGALIAIGLRSPELVKRAFGVARAIGRVDVDPGETGCKTPDAAGYIAKTRDRKKQKKTARKARAAKTTAKSDRPAKKAAARKSGR